MCARRRACGRLARSSPSWPGNPLEVKWRSAGKAGAGGRSGRWCADHQHRAPPGQPSARGCRRWMWAARGTLAPGAVRRHSLTDTWVAPGGLFWVLYRLHGRPRWWPRRRARTYAIPITRSSRWFRRHDATRANPHGFWLLRGWTGSHPWTAWVPAMEDSFILGN